jgi:hypothetical protein
VRNSTRLEGGFKHSREGRKQSVGARQRVKLLVSERPETLRGRHREGLVKSVGGKKVAGRQGGVEERRGRKGTAQRTIRCSRHTMFALPTYKYNI